MAVPNDGAVLEPQFKQLDYYQTFSSEVLRISLIGLGAIGLMSQQDKGPALRFSEGVFVGVPLTLIQFAVGAFVLASAFSLAHRYFSSDSMSYMIDIWRLEQRLVSKNDAASSSDDASKSETIVEIKQAKKGRDRLFDYSTISIIAAATLLAIGITALAAALMISISSSPASSAPAASSGTVSLSASGTASAQVSASIPASKPIPPPP